MNYHINTILIWDSFKAEGCPLCLIQQQVEKNAVSLYLNEAVMDDGCRAQVNRYGFCPEHFKKLWQGDNKLGLALQVHTRLKYIAENIDSLKALSVNTGCVICNIIEMHIKKYCGTIAKMFIEDKEFKNTFNDCTGFCIPHYNKLLSVKADRQFKNQLKKMQYQKITAMCDSLEQLTDRYSASNTDKPSKSKDTLKNSINMMCGKIIE